MMHIQGDSVGKVIILGVDTIGHVEEIFFILTCD